jgi:pimeloyl-ACP methyl ester carboxylesterase
MTADPNTGEIRRGTIEANGLRFAFLEAGEGPLVLLLHGFPDDAWTWSRQMPALADAGYRAVAPYLRGYHPTEVPADARYDPGVLATDVVELTRALGEDSACLVGNDWGGISTYAAMALFPQAVRRSVVIATGHPLTLLPTVLDPRQTHHIFHFWFFQNIDFAASAVRANDFAWIDYLWRHWSTEGHDDSEHIARVKRETLSPEGALEAVLGYYPGLFHVGETHPEVAEKLRQKTTVPTLSIFGAQDPPRDLAVGEEAHFTAPYRRELVEGAGHFVHREQPDEVTSLVLDWLAAGDREPAAVATPETL